MLHCVENETKPGDEQRNREQLSHRRAAPQKAELGIGFAEELAEAARDSVDAGKAADNEAGPLECAATHQHGKHREQQQALKSRLIKLAGMARQWAAIGEYHGPRHIGRTAPEFAVDEIGDAAEKYSDRPDRAGDVAEREDGDAALACEQHHRDDAAGEAAMERHAAVPELEDFEWMFDEVRQIVEQHIAGAAAEDDAERHPEHEVVEIEQRHGRGAAPEPLVAHDGAGIDPTEQDAGDIGERVPSDGERPEMDQHWVESRVGDDE